MGRIGFGIASSGCASIRCTARFIHSAVCCRSWKAARCERLSEANGVTSNYARGRAREYRCQAILEAAGYQTIRAASSKGIADVVAVNGSCVRFISVKSGGCYASAIEREALKALKFGSMGAFSVEIWRFPDRCKEPLIEVL